MIRMRRSCYRCRHGG